MAVTKLLDPSTLFLIRCPFFSLLSVLNSPLSSLSLSLSPPSMASESTTTTETETEMSSSAFEQLRSGLSLVPLLIGLMRPSPGSEPDRVVLVNPVTQGMIVFHGDVATITEILGGGAGRRGAPPASKASIQAMRSVDSAELQGWEEECSVCLDGLKEEEVVVVKEMPCRHRFHGACIEKWLKMHGSCPVCRFQMPREEGAGLKKEGDEEGEGEGDGERRRGRGRGIWVTISVSRNNDSASDEHSLEQGEEDRLG